MVILFARNLLRRSVAEEILFVFCFDVRPGARTLASRLISQHTTYYYYVDKFSTYEIKRYWFGQNRCNSSSTDKASIHLELL